MLFLSLLLPQWGQRAPLQPYEVHSASGEWTLEVKPTDPLGKGPMHARILHGREATWSGDFEWTFEAAGVADDGTCVGYANQPELRIAVLDARGELRKQHAFDHTASILHGPDLPYASGPVLVHSKAGLALIRVQPDDQGRPAPWRAFRLSSGEAAPDVVPAAPLKLAVNQSVYAGEARVIGDTQLTLRHWWFADFDPADIDWSQEGGVFALHDLTGKLVWSLALLDDYTVRTSEEETNQLARETRQAGVILSAGPGNRFVLRHVRAGERVEYGIEADNAHDGWVVKELTREPWSKAAPMAASSAEPIELVQEAKVELRSGSPAAVHPIHGVVDLGFTEKGEIELFRREDQGTSYARLRTNGELVFERDLTPALSGEQMQQFNDLSGDRWLVQVLGNDPPWITLDVRTGATSVAPLPDAELGCHVAPFTEGGYLALLSRTVQYTVLSELYRVAADDTVVWQHSVIGIGPDSTDFDRAVSSGRGLARTGQRTFALLGMALTRIDGDRNVLQTWKLEDILGHGAGYMNGLLSDQKGGVLFEEGDAFHQVDAFGTRTATFVPRRGDGSRDGIMDRLLRVAPDGRLWTSDRQRVYRLDPNGVADLTLGPEVRDDELVEAAEVEIDGLGRVLAQDRASRSVHVFDANGRRTAVCRLAPAERDDGYRGNQFHGAPDGSVWVATSAGGVLFDAAGARVEDPQRGNAARNAKRPQEAALNAMKVRPDGTWLESVEERGILPDGRRVLLERPRSGGGASLHFYTTEGAPLDTLALPAGEDWYQLSPGARWIVAGGFGPTWTLVRLEDQRVFRFESGLDGAGNWKIGQTPDGRTLLLLHTSRLQLVRYALP